MPENMSKPSMLPAPNRFQYAPSFIGTYQHLYVCHLHRATTYLLSKQVSVTQINNMASALPGDCGIMSLMYWA